MVVADDEEPPEERSGGGTGSRQLALCLFVHQRASRVRLAIHGGIILTAGRGCLWSLQPLFLSPSGDDGDPIFRLSFDPKFAASAPRIIQATGHGRSTHPTGHILHTD